MIFSVVLFVSVISVIAAEEVKQVKKCAELSFYGKKLLQFNLGYTTATNAR